MAEPDPKLAAMVTSLRSANTRKMDNLRAEFSSRADSEGVLDLAYRVMDSPLGPLLLAATDRGLVRVAFVIEDHDKVLESLSDRVSPRILQNPNRLEKAARELDEYFSGRRRSFDISMDLRLATGFRRTILDHLPNIEFGSTASYTAVAAMAGNPRAVRAVGTACALNPLPIVIPCHRVVRSDGTIGNYLGGTAAKVQLLAMEGKGAE